MLPGGGSRADLVGMSGATLKLFELKVNKNYRAGALSELLSYASILREASAISPRINFKNKKRNKFHELWINRVQKCARIEAILIADRVHPLIEHTSVMDVLNAAIRKKWPDKEVVFSFRKIDPKWRAAAA